MNEKEYISSYDNIRKVCLNNNLGKIFDDLYIEDLLVNKKHQDILENWKLKIININLNADIAEGTTNEVLNKNIGHFEETNYLKGNIGFAAHNRGFFVNYFENLDKVKIGDVIEYQIDNYKKLYKVNVIKIIKDTDWSYLGETEEDVITLITCVKNKPEYRLCVRGDKEKEEINYNAEEIYSSRFGNGFIIKCDFSRIC